MNANRLGAILLAVLMLLTAACGSIQEAVEQRVAETIVEQIGGEGAMATLESASAAVQAELDRRDLDGDGVVSDEEAQIAANAPGSSMMNPIRMTSGERYEGVSNLLSPVFYQADVPAGGVVNLNVANTGTADLTLSLSNTPFGTSYPSTLTPGQSIDVPMLYGSNSAQLMVMVLGLAEANYTLSAQIATQNDGNTGTDAGNADSPTPIQPGLGLTGQYGGDDGEDYFSLRLQDNDIFEVTVTSSPNNREAMSLYGELSGGTYHTLNNILPGDTQTLSLGSVGDNLATFGFYYGGNVQYTFDVVVRQGDDNGTGGDVGHTLATAAPIAVGQTVSGVSLMEDWDCYKFSLASAQRIVVDVTSPSPQPYEAPVNVELRDTSGSALTWATAEYGFQAQLEYGTAEDPASAGDYLLCASVPSFWYPLGYYEFVVSTP